MGTVQGHTPDPRSAPSPGSETSATLPQSRGEVHVWPCCLQRCGKQASAGVGLETADRLGAKDCAPTGVLPEKLYSSFAAAACSMIDVFKCRARP
jgi:hypothetical protein